MKQKDKPTITSEQFVQMVQEYGPFRSAGHLHEIEDQVAREVIIKKRGWLRRLFGK